MDLKKMAILLILLILSFKLHAQNTEIQSYEQLKITITPIVLGDSKVQFIVKTNLMKKFKVSLGFDFIDNGKVKIGIGDSAFINIVNGEGSYLFTSDQSNFTGKKFNLLPPGEYMAEVRIYESWAFRDNPSEKPNWFNIDVIQNTKFKLKGNTSLQVIKQLEIQKKRRDWVLRNVNYKDKWNLKLLETKLGKSEKLDMTGSNHNYLIHGYYFPEANFTIFHNTYYNFVSHVRDGKSIN